MISHYNKTTVTFILVHSLPRNDFRRLDSVAIAPLDNSETLLCVAPLSSCNLYLNRLCFW